MRDSRLLIGSAVLAALAACGAPAAQEAGAPDLVLVNGKIITADERFTVAGGVAVRGGRFMAVGDAEDIARLAGPETRTIDLQGRTVVPGLIDNHLHLLRAGATWAREVRLDGVGSRREALDRIRARAGALAPGEWIFTLGGWTVDQFGDDPSPLSRGELDAVAPKHPVFLQASYYEAYLNTTGLDRMGLAGGANAPPWLERDAAGQATGRVAEAGMRALASRLPAAGPEEVESSTRAMIRDLNAAGITAAGSAGCQGELLDRYRAWAREGTLNMRVFCITGSGASSPDQVDRALPRIAGMRVFEGDAWIDHVAFGESVYGPLHDPMFSIRPASPSDLLQWRRMTEAVARARLPLHVHANFAGTIGAFLDQVEAVNREVPIGPLRWTFAHTNQLTADHLTRMRTLGMSAAVHPWAVINGGINRRVFGDAALGMAPLRTIQESGVTWGFGSDGTRANQVLPFETLSWAVTGRMVGGASVLRREQTISREDALVAHTRTNAYLLFQENNLGSIQPGHAADLVVLDRDYLTVPADEIADIRSVMTMVGGRVVFDAR